MNNLKGKIERILSWAQNNNIQIFKGNLPEEKKAIEWNDNSEEGFSEFLDLIKKTAPKIIILSYDRYNSEFDDQDKLYLKNLDESDKIRANELCKLLKAHHNEIMAYEISFIQDSQLYTFHELAEFEIYWLELQELLENGKHNIYFDEEENKNVEVIAIARELAKNHLFQIAQNQNQRDYASNVFFQNVVGKKITNFRKKDIIETAQSIYKLEIEPKIEEELREKIENLIEKGLTKSKIAGQLKISINKLNNLIS
ncbi:MAG: hypothetical protein MUO72_08465 [Bacteroidales bacterium]|nr:hypothetical protein [Bacteroidales bacterium]